MCDFKTAHKYNLQSHFNTIHLGIKNNQCTYCDKAFNKKGDLMKHIEQFHSTPLVITGALLDKPHTVYPAVSNI